MHGRATLSAAGLAPASTCSCSAAGRVAATVCSSVALASICSAQSSLRPLHRDPLPAQQQFSAACRCTRCGAGAEFAGDESHSSAVACLGPRKKISDGKSGLPENLPLPVVSEKRIPAKFRIFRFQNSKIQKNS